MEYFFGILALILTMLISQWIILFCFFFLPSFNKVKKLKDIHGEFKKIPPRLRLDEIIRSSVYVPIIEETIFRVPVLFLSLIGQTILAFCAVIICAILFGLAHKSKASIYPDGTVIWISSIEIGFICICGFMCGLIVVITNSLWPAIVLHGLWNLSVGLMYTFIDEDRIADLIRNVKRQIQQV